MVEGGMSCVKYLLFAFNFLFFLIGLILIIAGAVIQGYFQQYFDIVEGQFSAVAILLIFVGVIIFAIGFFGCCGAWKENRCMILTFTALLIIIFILEIAGGIAGLALRSSVQDVVKEGMHQSLDKYDNLTADKETWDAIQHDLQCCGINSYADWKGKLDPPQLYPKSCCKLESTTGCGTLPDLAYPDGCLQKLDSAIQGNLIWIGVIGIIVALIQIIGITCACCLARSIRKEYDTV